MKPMGNRLSKVLSQSIENYTDKDLERDLKDIEKEIVDIDYKEINIEDEELNTDRIRKNEYRFNVADELLDVGLITREEFDKKKNELMS